MAVPRLNESTVKPPLPLARAARPRSPRSPLRSLSTALLATAVVASGVSACSGEPPPDGTGGGGSTSTSTSTSDSTSDSTSASGSSSSGGPPAVFSPAPGGLRRLLARQYVNSVGLLLGPGPAALAKPPKDAQLHGFDAIGAAELALSSSAIEAYEQSARDISALAVSDKGTFVSIVPCKPAAPDDQACYQKFVEKFGRLAFRRPVTPEEAGRLVNVAVTAGKAFNSFEAGVAAALSAMLQSPHFLYLTEVGDPDADDTSRRTLSAYELASRISFFLLDTTPDAALLDAAAQGALDTPDGVRQVAQGLLKKPEARTALESFYSEIFRLRELNDLAKDQALYPQFTPALKTAMREETLRVINDIVWDRNTDARELLDADFTFVNKDLAALYGISPPAGDGYERVSLSDAQGRGGLLGQASFLARFSHPATTSPTRRGLFVKSMLLCREISSPPPGVNTTLPEDDPGNPQTKKEKLEVHRANPTCAGCHDQMDPLGLAMEHFDTIGAYRTTDNGLPLDTSGKDNSLGTFSSPKEIGALLYDDPRAAECMIKNIFRNSLGHLETKGEAPAIDDLEQAFAAANFRLQDLLVELCVSPAFHAVAEPK